MVGSHFDMIFKISDDLFIIFKTMIVFKELFKVSDDLKRSDFPSLVAADTIADQSQKITVFIIDGKIVILILAADQSDIR